ncbi:MAG: hypothetical protein NXY57DRAFT_1017991 [Lentinula lateritia]|nr:MAG: hypothetical protein NXY57DRAFT_1017991 [Lentinula lateritia]
MFSTFLLHTSRLQHRDALRLHSLLLHTWNAYRFSFRMWMCTVPLGLPTPHSHTGTQGQQGQQFVIYSLNTHIPPLDGPPPTQPVSEHDGYNVNADIEKLRDAMSEGVFVSTCSVDAPLLSSSQSFLTSRTTCISVELRRRCQTGRIENRRNFRNVCDGGNYTKG